MAPDASAVEVMSNSRRESFRFRIDSGFNRQSICSLDHLVGAGEQCRWDGNTDGPRAGSLACTAVQGLPSWPDGREGAGGSAGAPRRGSQAQTWNGCCQYTG